MFYVWDSFSSYLFTVSRIFFLLDLGKEGLKSKAGELWQNILRLETEKYDLEERQKRQGYDVNTSKILKILKIIMSYISVTWASDSSDTTLEVEGCPNGVRCRVRIPRYINLTFIFCLLRALTGKYPVIWKILKILILWKWFQRT